MDNITEVLGSKTFGLNVIELHFIMQANHDQNVLSCFRFAQSMFMCKVGIKCESSNSVNHTMNVQTPKSKITNPSYMTNIKCAENEYKL